MATASALVAQPAPTAGTEVQDQRPLLWNGLHAGMSPREVLAALQGRGIRARLATDPANGREYVETPRETNWAGRPYLIAIGFVGNRLFYVEVNSQRTLSGRIPFDRSHFSHVARFLTEQYGQAVEISPEPTVTDVDSLSASTSTSAIFERGGVRAELRGNNLYRSFTHDVVETVSVRFWRIVDAETLAASQPPPKPVPQP